MINKWIKFYFFALVLPTIIFFPGGVKYVSAEIDNVLFQTAPINPDFQDYIDDPRAEPLFDDEGNYFGFIPLPFAPEKHVVTDLLQASITLKVG